MEYARIPNIASSIPHFGEAFPSPSPSPCNTFVAPLSASSLQAYNQLNASIMSKRKVRDFDILLQSETEHDMPFHDPKRLYLEQRGGLGHHVPNTRQRQESGCSIMSTSSWSSSASYSTVSSSSAASSPMSTSLSPSSSPASMPLPDLTSSSTRSRSSTMSSMSSTSRSSSPAEIDSEEHMNPLWHICDAIALAEKQDDGKKTTSNNNSNVRTLPRSMVFYDNNNNNNNNKTKSDDGVKIVVLEPNWLAEHMAKSKKVAALKKQQQLQQQQLRH